jgi:hypothetical protein
MGALAGERSKRSGSRSLTTTHALFALKVQRKVSNGVAGLSPPHHLWIGRNRGNCCRSAIDQRLRKHAC